MKHLLLGVLLCLAGAAAAPPEELSQLRRENEELRRKLLKSEGELRALRLFLGELSETAEAAAPGEREQRQLALLAALCASGSELALKTDDFCNEAVQWLPDTRLGPSRQAHLSLELDSLRRAARRFILLADDSKVPLAEHRCRILSLDRKARLVLIAAGSNQGIFPGMIYSTMETKNPVRLIVVGTRPEASGCKVIQGDFNALHTGMELSNFKAARANRLLLPGRSKGNAPQH